MQTLWQKTFALFRQYPVLWVPVACADLAGFFSRSLQQRILLAFLMRLTATHSVLGPDEPPIPGASNLLLAIVAAAILRLGIQSLIVWGFTAALFLTVKQVGKRLVPPVPAVRADQRQRIFRFTLRSAVPCIVVAFLASTLLFPSVFTVTRELGWLRPQYVGEITGVLVMLGLVYWLTPQAIHSVAELYGRTVDKEIDGVGRKAATLAVVASNVLSAIASMTHFSHHDVSLRWVTAIIISLIVAAPYAMLFVAFGVLVLQPTQDDVSLASLGDEPTLPSKQAALL